RSSTCGRRCKVTPATRVALTPTSAGAADTAPADNEPAPSYPTMRAGFPATIAIGGTSLVTTAPAPTMSFSPMVSPGRMVALAPMDAPRLTRVRAKRAGCCPLRGKGSLEKVALGPTNTSSCSVTPSQTWTPHLMVTRSPMRTSFSMNVWSQMLQAAPITAPGRTWANAQMRVPAPIEGLSTIAVSCWKKPPSANAGLQWEGLQRAHYGGYFVVLQLGITGQRQNLASRPLGLRQLRRGLLGCPEC